MISESWAHDSISDVELNLSGFNLIRSDRLFSKGGGCMLDVKELYKTINVDDLRKVQNSVTVWCELTSTKYSLIIGVCHHSTSVSVVNEVALRKVIGQACRSYKNVLICGDLSHRTIDLDFMQCNREGHKFLDLTLDCFLHQHVDEPTRGENILYLVLSSYESMVDNLLVHELFANSDHNFIIFDLFCDVSMTYWNELYHDFRRGNIKAMKNELGLIDWLEMFSSKNVVEMWLVFFK